MQKAVSFFGGLFLSLFCIRKVPLGKVGVRVGLGGYFISDTWIFCLPLVTRFELMDISIQKLEIDRKGQDGLICRDNIRSDIVADFYIKVNYPKVSYPDGVEPDSPEGRALWEQAMNSRGQDKFEDVLKVAQAVGCEQAANPEKLRELFEAKLINALKTIAKEMDFEMLYARQAEFPQMIAEKIDKDLKGYRLEDVEIGYLEQTPI